MELVLKQGHFVRSDEFFRTFSEEAKMPVDYRYRPVAKIRLRRAPSCAHYGVVSTVAVSPVGGIHPTVVGVKTNSVAE